MKKILKSSILLFAILSYYNTSAQTNPQDQVINDLLIIADNYVAPGAQASAIQSSAGWFTSAVAMEKWHIEVSLHGNALFIPNSKKTHSLSNNDFEIVNIRGSESATLPTIFGGNSNVVFEGIIFEGEPFEREFSFDALKGLDKNILIHPFPQITVGMPYQSEVAVRFLPRIVIDDVAFSTYGFGLKHNISQYFRGPDPAAIQFAANITYSNFQADYAFPTADIEIAELNSIDVNADLWLLQLMASKRFNTLEVFGALGTTISQFDYELGGTGGGLDMLNEALDGHDWDETKFKGDFGLNFYCGDLKISSMITVGSFINANIGVHYRITPRKETDPVARFF